MFQYSFPWFCGAYGLAGPNKKIPRLHLFLTVKRGTKKLDVRRDLEKKFECDAKQYFELLQEPKEEPKIKYLGRNSNGSSAKSSASSAVSSVQPTPGGSVVSCIFSGPNPLLMPGGNEKPEEQGSGTLTMFCFSEGHHYALTCFHVGCANDKMRLNAMCNIPENIQEIRSSLGTHELCARRKTYFFTKDQMENNNEPISCVDDQRDYTPLGDFHKYCFDSECDILSLKISQSTRVKCKVADATSRDWASIWDELLEKFEERSVEVNKIRIPAPSTNGHIVSCNISYGKEQELFKNAIAVKGCTGPFLQDGDSGSLVFFIDKNNQKQVFAYGVCQVDELHLPAQQISSIDYDSDGSDDSDDSDDSSTWGEDDFSSNGSEDKRGSEDELKNEAVGEDKVETEYEDEQSVEIEDKIKCQKDNECGDESENADKRECGQDNECEVKCRGKNGPEYEDEIECEDGDECEKDDRYHDDGDANDESDEGIIFQKDTGPYFICLRLDTALENLELRGAACVNDCGQTDA